MAPPASSTTPSAAPSPPAVDEARLHAARRLTFGPTPPLLDDLASNGIEGWFHAQCRPSSIDDTETDRRLWALSGLGFDAGRLLPEMVPVLDAVGLTPVVDAGSELLAATANTLDDLAVVLMPFHWRLLHRVITELRLATVVRATYSRRQVLEQLVDFWWNHFNVWPGKHPLVAGMMVAADREVIRPGALGRFSELLQASAASPAMLAYLDNWLNRAGSPNENFARELLELHTVGVHSGFTEADVRDAARVFTGWSFADLGRGFRFVPAWHDTGPKQVLGWSTPGRSGRSGVEEGRSLLDHLARHPSTARHLATELTRRFVADDPPADLVSSTADVYLASGTATVPVLEHIVGSEAFRSSAGAKIRRPLDFFVAALRSTGAQLGDPIGPSAAAAGTLDHVLTRLGQRPFDARSPAGYPERADTWLGAGLLQQWSVAHELARGELAGVAVDPGAIAGTATTAGAAVDAVLARLHGSSDPDRRPAILAGLGMGEDDTVDPRQLPELVALGLCTAEAHRR